MNGILWMGTLWVLGNVRGNEGGRGWMEGTGRLSVIGRRLLLLLVLVLLRRDRIVCSD